MRKVSLAVTAVAVSLGPSIALSGSADLCTPETIGSFSGKGDALEVERSGTLALFASGSELRVFETADLANPAEIAAWAPGPSSIHAISIDGNTMYVGRGVGFFSETVVAFDLSSLPSLTPIAFSNGPDTAQNVRPMALDAPGDGRVYAASSPGFRGLAVYDAASLDLLSMIPLPVQTNNLRDVAVFRDTAFVSAPNVGIFRINLPTPDSQDGVHLISGTAGTVDMYREGNRLAITDQQRARIFEVGDEGGLSLIAQIDFPGILGSLWASISTEGNLVYLGSERGLYAYDIANPGNPTLIALDEDARASSSIAPQGTTVLTGGNAYDIASCLGGPCNAADLAEPFGQLDLADIGGFVGAFTTGGPAADLDENGLFDLADIGLFIDAFVGGCP